MRKVCTALMMLLLSSALAIHPSTGKKFISSRASLVDDKKRFVACFLLLIAIAIVIVL